MENTTNKEKGNTLKMENKGEGPLGEDWTCENRRRMT